MNAEIIRDIRKKFRLTQQDFSNKYNIPLRTLQSWESGEREPADYIVDMIAKIAGMDLSQTAPYGYALVIYNGQGGIGAETNLGQRAHDAIIAGKNAWDSLNWHDQRRYSPKAADKWGSMFYVGLFRYAWDDVAMKWITDGDPIDVVWDVADEWAALEADE